MPSSLPINVLLVEDNRADARLVQEALRDATEALGSPGFEVAWVDRIAEGLRHLTGAGADVTLLDLSLPDARGLEALTAVRAHMPHIPVVVLTGLDDEELALRAVRQGAQDYFVKGELQGATLARAIRYAIERARELAVQDQLLLRERTARAEATAANHAKSSFLAMMSHELRTPLNAIIGYTELLTMGIAGGLNDTQQDYIQRVDASSRHMLTLVGDLLDLAKIEANQLDIRIGAAHAADAVRHAMSLVELQAAARDLTITTGCDDTSLRYRGDEERVRQIIVNILANAVRFTDPGGRIDIACAPARQPPAHAIVAPATAWVSIGIRDTGVGIAPERTESIFEPFVQGEAGYTRTHGGTGLGLTISRRLARLMGGDIVMRSTPGVGSEFVLWLPAA